MIAAKRSQSPDSEALRGSESQVRDADKILAAVMAGVVAPGPGKVGAFRRLGVS